MHFHPDGRMAAKFVDPLVDAERKFGFTARLITSIRSSKTSDQAIPYDLSLRNLLLLPVSFFRICGVILKYRPDILISHNTKSSILPLFAGWLLRVKSRVYYNHGVPYIGYQGVLRVILRLFERVNCFLATDVVTISGDMVSLLKNVSSSISPKVINNGSACGLDLSVYSPLIYKNSSWRADNNIKDADLVVVFVGRPERRKGFELALRIWVENFKSPHFKLVLCGPDVSDVLKYLPKVPSNILCKGFVDNIPEVLSASDVLILPSLHEGLSYACMEAQACGAVVVANKIDGVRSIVQDGVSGYLVENNLAAAYVKIINNINDNRKSMSVVKNNAYISVQKYARESFISFYLDYISTLSGKRRRS
nr:glycosyltransferase [Pusillimonas minor]